MGNNRTKVGDVIGIHIVLNIFYRYNGRKATYVEVSCPCGDTHIVHLGHLKESGKAICNCDVTGYFLNKRDDASLMGKKFGRLTILEIIRGLPNNLSYAVCSCECGNEIIAIKNNVTKGTTTSCGCYLKEAITGMNLKDWTGIVSEWGVEFLERSTPNDKMVYLWKCRCPICGSIFERLPYMITSGQVRSCGCLITSWGEGFINTYMDRLNIKFKREFTFDDCRGESGQLPLRFDFALFDDDDNMKCLIEYDGFQHEKPVEFFGGDVAFESVKINDTTKNKYCQDNNIPLYRIKYEQNEYTLTAILDYIIDTNLNRCNNEQYKMR